MNANSIRSLLLTAALAAAVLLAPRGCPSPSPPRPQQILILYESLHGPPPTAALAAAQQLAGQGREVWVVDDDTVDGRGRVPPWLAPALEAGRAVMGGPQDEQQRRPALVLVSGSSVRALALPASAEEIVRLAEGRMDR